MNLLYFDCINNESRFFFNNAQLSGFFNLFSNNEPIIIRSIFAHSSTKEYDKSDFSESITIGEIKNFKHENNSVLIDSIDFTIGFLRVDISDEYEYLITSFNPYFKDFIRKLYELLKINDAIFNEVCRNRTKYIFVDNQKVIEKFSNFDEFLMSKYSSLL